MKEIYKAQRQSLQSGPTPRDPVDCSAPGFSVNEILQGRILEWVAISFSNIYNSQGQMSASLWSQLFNTK